MNYEEKYKRALEKAKSLLKEEGNKLNVKTLCEYFFPELKESEDERIRKEIVDFITSSNKYGTNEICEAWLNWLEKQGNRKMLDADKVIAWLDNNICNAYDYDGNEITTTLKSKFKHDFEL